MKTIILLITWMIVSAVFLLVYENKNAGKLEKTIIIILCLPWAVIAKTRQIINKIKEN